MADGRRMDLTLGMDPARKRAMLASLARDRAKEPVVPKGFAARAPRHDQGTERMPAHQPQKSPPPSKGAEFMGPNGRLPGGHGGSAQQARHFPNEVHPGTIARQNQIPITAQDGRHAQMEMHPNYEGAHASGQTMHPSGEHRRSSGQYQGGTMPPMRSNLDNEPKPGW